MGVDVSEQPLTWEQAAEAIKENTALSLGILQRSSEQLAKYRSFRAKVHAGFSARRSASVQLKVSLP